MPPLFVTVAVEGLTDVPVARRLLQHVGFDSGPEHITSGKARLDVRLGGYNAAARHHEWLVLRDLDHDGECAPELIGRRLPRPAARMCLRIAVRATEAWLMADAVPLAGFLGVRRSLVPPRPDDLDDPKAVLVGLARYSRKRAIRDDMVPAVGTTARVGPGFAARVIEFATGEWRPGVASGVSPSLAKAVTALRRWAHP
ncbi:MAG: hypothetical protein HY905_20840 [Deltaproteobacteria bacterium]|nr:hypothetical protein [Deltaproteobacteria bacterium]